MDVKPRGQVRVGTCRFEKGKRVDPSYPGFTPIVCLTASSRYGMLSPYCLKAKIRFSSKQFPTYMTYSATDSSVYNGSAASEIETTEEHECLVEDCYQFSKVYAEVPAACETRSRFDNTGIWKWPAQTHCVVTPQPGLLHSKIAMTMAYFLWRKSGMCAPEPIRYPVGQRHMDKCLFSLRQNEDGTVDPRPLDYIQSRKAIYLPYYNNAVKQHPEFLNLQARLHQGENLLIIEVDGPRARSMEHYKKTYGVGDNFIENDTILVDAQRLEILLNDDRERYGHGYCLAGCLLGIY